MDCLDFITRQTFHKNAHNLSLMNFYLFPEQFDVLSYFALITGLYLSILKLTSISSFNLVPPSKSLKIFKHNLITMSKLAVL